MKLSTKIILPIIIISALLILLVGCFAVPPEESPGYTPGTTTITGIIAAPCCTTSSTTISEDSTPSDWCLQCEQDWFLQENIEVILTYEGEEIGSTTTNAQGEYTFTDLSAGENYVITAICPDDGGKPLVKDVVEEVVDGEDYDAGITDCESTALGLIVDALVNLGISSEYIILEDILSAVQFVPFVEAVCEVIESCGDITSDENLLDLGNLVLMEVLGENPGWTGGEVICVFNPPCVGVPTPTADAGGLYIETLVCIDGDEPGDSVKVYFNGSASGAGTFTYLWKFGDGYTSIEEDPTHTYASPTAAFYIVTLTVTGDGTNTCGSDTDATTVNINYVPCEGECPLPTADAGPDQSEEVCPGGAQASIDFTGSGTGTGDLNYYWDFDGNGTSTDQTPSGILFGVGTYYVTLTVTDDCDSTTDTMIVTITESAGVIADAGPDQSEEVCPCPGASVTIFFDGSGSSGAGTLTYDWDFGDGNSALDAGPTPSHVYSCPFDDSPYTVTLTVTDDCDSTTDTMTVTITECINQAPKINYIPDKTVCKYGTFTYTVTVDPATVDAGETLTYRLLHAPPSMTINAGTGKITWDANCDEQSAGRGDKCDECICYRDVTVEVEDDGCCGPLSDTEEFTICVKWCF